MNNMTVDQYTFTDPDFHSIRSLVAEHTGISLSSNKRELVYSRLSRRLRSLNLGSFKEYLSVLSQGDPREIEEFTNLITTNLTSFYREPHHFNYLEEVLLPDLIRKNSRTKRIRIWSAGCSTGEEPYSIAMSVRKVLPDYQSWDLKILATDLDSNVIAQARSGVYTEDRIEGIAPDLARQSFLRGGGVNHGKVKIIPELQSMIYFQQLNLMHDWPMSGAFDILFCRNVVISFDKQTQKKLFDRYANFLGEKGRLFIGHSESLHNITDRFRLLGKTIYEKAN